MIHMEGQEEQTQMIMIKGKRTKRQRPSSPFGGVGVTSSSSSAGGGEGFEEYGNSFTSATTSGGEVYESTEEEEDMANCLILLAQGDVPRQVERISDRRLLINEIAAATTATAGKTGFYVYECKTCNRTFPSFQALGGHRASHKKPKAMAAAAEEKKAAAAPPSHLITTSLFDDQYEDQSQSKQFMNKQSNVQNHKVNKIHECSICGSEFTSGQALGGHMRRHRAPGAPTSTPHVAMPAIDNNTKQRDNYMPLDLNLPAPEDHDHHHHHHHHHQRESKFQFVPTQQSTLVFNARSLVDCHY